MKNIKFALLMNIFCYFNASLGLDKEVIKQTIANMVQVDQNLRSKLNFSNLNESMLVEMRKLDLLHTESLKNILRQFFWVTISEFGAQTDHGAWLLVQHADHDLEFQKDILLRLEQLYKKQETDAKNFAYLYDRIAMAENRPQRYGTQGLIKDGKWVLCETEDLAQLDERRLSVGLSSYKDYKDQITAIYTLSVE